MPTVDYAQMKKCADCGTTKPLASFAPDRRRRDNLAANCATCNGVEMSADEVLATTDLKAVEILSAGGPYFGRGSPEKGDFFKRAELEAIAEANNDLASELRVPNKIGHNSAQRLLKNSGLAEDEQPAAGWLKNFRVEDNADGVAKLVADIGKVPRKLASLLKAGTFRTRSVELSRMTSQKTQKKYDSVVTGLAWLGAKAPAVRTLDDIIAWFSEGAPELSAAELLALDADPEGPVVVYAADPERILSEVVRFVDFAEGEVVWTSEEGFANVRSRVEAALNPGPGDQYRYWVRDVAEGKALVASSRDENEVWVVPFSLDDEGKAQIVDAAEWTLATQEWVAASGDKRAADRLAALGERENDKQTDTSASTMPDTKTKPAETTLSDEQIVSLAETFSIEETDEAKRREAVIAKLAEFAPSDGGDKPEGDGPVPPQPAPPKVVTEPETALSAADVEVLQARAEKGERAFEERRIEKRDHALQLALDEGRINPEKREFWQTAIDDDEERALVLLSEMPVNEDFKKVYGKDEDGMEPGTRENAETAEYRAYLVSIGENPDESIVLANAGSGS